jgi:hypothetical protein
MGVQVTTWKTAYKNCVFIDILSAVLKYAMIFTEIYDWAVLPNKNMDLQGKGYFTTSHILNGVL